MGLPGAVDRHLFKHPLIVIRLISALICRGKGKIIEIFNNSRNKASSAGVLPQHSIQERPRGLADFLD